MNYNPAYKDVRPKLKQSRNKKRDVFVDLKRKEPFYMLIVKLLFDYLLNIPRGFNMPKKSLVAFIQKFCHFQKVT